MNNYDRVIKNVQEIAENRDVKQLVKASISEIKLNRKSFVQYIFSAAVAILLSFIIVYKSDTVQIMGTAVETINSGTLAFVAIIFGTYSIFQALMTDAVVWALLKSENNLLNVSNQSFLHLILLYLFEIVINLILIIVLKCLPNEYCLFENIKITNAVAFTAITFYFGFCFLLFYEMKNFAVNLYQMFNVYNIYRAIELIGNQEKDELDE
jgi:hypothetical protein